MPLLLDRVSCFRPASGAIGVPWRLSIPGYMILSAPWSGSITRNIHFQGNRAMALPPRLQNYFFYYNIRLLSTLLTLRWGETKKRGSFLSKGIQGGRNRFVGRQERPLFMKRFFVCHQRLNLPQRCPHTRPLPHDSGAIVLHIITLYDMHLKQTFDLIEIIISFRHISEFTLRQDSYGKQGCSEIRPSARAAKCCSLAFRLHLNA